MMVARLVVFVLAAERYRNENMSESRKDLEKRIGFRHEPNGCA